MADATLHKTLGGHTSDVTSVAFSPDNKLLASASYDDIVRLWNLPNGELNGELKGHEKEVWSVAFSPDGKSIVTGSRDYSVRIWSVAAKQQAKILTGHFSSVNSVAWSPNGDVIASGSYDQTVILWDAISGSVKKKLKGHTEFVGSVSFSQNGSKLASAGDDNTAIIWDVDSGAALIKLVHSSWVNSICFSPDDQFVVTGCDDNTVRMFNANTGHEEKRFEGHNSLVHSVAISFDGSMIASGGGGRTLFGSDNSMRLWDVASNKQLQQLDGHTRMVASVAFSCDGKFIASGSIDKTVRLWNAPSSLQTPTSLLKAACFAGDIGFAKFQLDQGALVNNKDGSTALYAASSKGSKQLVELLIERGADINLRENSGSSALHAASYQGHKEVVEFLIVNGTDIKARDSSQNTALHISSLNGQAQVVACLLDRGLSINDKGNGGSTALHLASSRGHKQVVDLLIKRHADSSIRDDDQTSALNAKGCNGDTALHHASFQGDREFVELLIENGADLNLRNADQNTALHLAYLNNHMDVFEYLLNHGSLVDEKGKDGSTILHMASRQGNQQVIQLLIEHGANVNLRSADQKTALHLAYLNKHVDVFEYLLNHGSLVDEKGKDGSTILHLASRQGNQQVIQLLIEHGADVNLCDADQNTALHLAYLNKHVDVFEYLLNHGSLVDEKGKDGSTILHLASRQGNQQVVKLLIDHGADVNLRDQDQNTAFFVAFTNGHSEVAKYLLQCGTLVNAKSADGQTMLHQAIRSNNVALAQLLLQRGADINIADDSKRSTLQLANQSKSAEIKATFSQATSLQKKNLKSIPASTLGQTADFALHLQKNKFGPDIWDTLTSSSACKQFLVGLFLQSNPSLGTIPDSVAKLGQLLCLSVADCGLTSTDIRNISLFTSLRDLDLSNNPLVEIPNEFANLKELRRVSVSNCKLSAIPAFISQLSKIVFVDVSKNNINRIPVALASIPSLTDLVLSGNPLSSIPSEYHTKPTEQLFAYLRDLATESKAVYRSKLLLVGYGGVGKTTLLNGMFPLEGILEFKSTDWLDILNPWQKRFCKITGSNLVFYLSTTDTDGLTGIELYHSTITEIDDVEWKVKTHNEAIYEFRCSSTLEREEWVRVCRFHAKNYSTDGISVVYRDIPSDHLHRALLACALQDQTNRVPNHASLQLSVWDFAGQHEYQDGHQLFLTSRAIYLVLWDVRPKKRQTSLAQLRHWLSTLQLHLGSSDANIRSSALVYVVGSFADGGGVNLEQCRKDAQQAVDSVHLTVAYRIIPGLCLRKQTDVNGLKVQLLADLATQQHLGEEVPTAYLDLEHRLRQDQDRYRLSQLQNNKSNVIPVLKRSDLVLQLKLETGLVTRALELLHMWGSIVYLGGKHARLNELVVGAPEWLTVGVLGSLVRLMRVEISKQIDAKVNVAPIVHHKDLLDHFDVWRSLQSDQQEEVLQALYAFDLGFAASMADNREFCERSSFFPQLLPVKPPSSFEWMPNTSTPEVSRVIELNGIPMGFNTVLLSRLRSCLPDVYLPSCWHSGFLFQHIEDDNNRGINDDDDQWRVLLVTVHEDSSRIRFCVRNSSDFNRVFDKVIGVFRQLLVDRYHGVRILNEFVECVCDGCQTSKWRWNKTIANDVFADRTITRLMADTASRAEFSQAILLHAQPNEGPHNFLLSTIKREIDNGRTTVNCPKSHQAVKFVALTQTTLANKLKVHEIPRRELTKDTKLSEGKFGIVWRGTYNGIPVAIKEPKLDGDADLIPSKQLADLIEEAIVMTSISAHPNVLHCYGISRVGDDDYLLATELCNLGSLESFLKTYPGTPAVDRRRFSQQVARGLNHLSKHNIAHRDVAARNVLLHDQGGVIVAKVCDFGLSRQRQGEYYKVTGQHLLAPETAPEVFETRKHSSRSDVWSFGVLLWEVESLCATRAKPNKEVFPPLPKPAQASDNMYEIMLKCWAKDPHQRPSFEALIDMLA